MGLGEFKELMKIFANEGVAVVIVAGLLTLAWYLAPKIVSGCRHLMSRHTTFLDETAVTQRLQTELLARMGNHAEDHLQTIEVVRQEVKETRQNVVLVHHDVRAIKRHLNLHDSDPPPGMEHLRRPPDKPPKMLPQEG